MAMCMYVCREHLLKRQTFRGSNFSSLARSIIPVSMVVRMAVCMAVCICVLSLIKY